MSNDYIDRPTKVRIFTEPTTAPDGTETIQWSIDGIDGEGGYTEAVATYDTWHEAMAGLPLFYGMHVLGYKITARYPDPQPQQACAPAQWIVSGGGAVASFGSLEAAERYIINNVEWS
jgi:hypothetical protein